MKNLRLFYKFQKTIFFLIYLCCCSFIFSSCRLKNPETETTIKTKQEKIELTFWNLFDDSEVFRGQIQAYQSKHPHIKIKYKKFTDIQEYEQLLINEIAEGEGPDIFTIKNSWIKKHQKKITPLPIGKTAAPLNPQIFADTFFHVATKDLVIEQQIYGIPLYIDTLALYYNKQIFRDNITNTDTPGSTWPEIKKQVSVITKENNSIERFALSGIAMGRSQNILRAQDIFYSLMLEHEVDIFNTAQNRSIVANQKGVNEETNKPFFPFLESLKLYSSFGNSKYKNYSWNELITAFAPELKEIDLFLKGKVAMIFGYSYLYEDLLSIRQQLQKQSHSVIKTEDIGITEFPQIKSFQETGKRDSLAIYFPITVSRNSKHALEAWNFIQYLSSKEALQDYHEKTKKLSSRKDLIDEQIIEPIYGVFAKQVSYAKSFPKKFPINANFLDQVFGLAIENAVKNKLTLEKITQKAQERINCQLEKSKKRGEVDINCLDI